MRFKIDWASLIPGRRFTVLFCFTLLLRAISKYKPHPRGRGAYIWRGDLTVGFLHYEFGELIFGEVYFRNFTVSIPWYSCQYCCPSLLCFKTTVSYLPFIILSYFIYQHLPIVLLDIIIRL